MHSATNAVATHIIARNTLDLATPSLLMVMAQSEKARLEHRRASERTGPITLAETYDGLKSLIPFVRKKGSR